MSEIAILGAAGQTGLATIDALAQLGASVRAVVHRDAQQDDVRGAGAQEAVSCELADVPGLTRALAGVRTLLLIPPVFSPLEPDYTRATCEAARAAGVERVVLHSVLHAHTPTMPHHMRKAASEAILRASPLRWTILQPAMYAQTPMMFIAARHDGLVPVPFDASRRFTVIDALDLAEITARVLAEDGHDYAGYELVGSAPLSVAEMVEQSAEILGERLAVERVQPWELPLPPRVSRGMASFAAMCDEYDGHGLLGNAGICTWLLGRTPASFADAARRALLSRV